MQEIWHLRAKMGRRLLHSINRTVLPSPNWAIHRLTIHWDTQKVRNRIFACNSAIDKKLIPKTELTTGWEWIVARALARDRSSSPSKEGKGSLPISCMWAVHCWVIYGWEWKTMYWHGENPNFCTFHQKPCIHTNLISKDWSQKTIDHVSCPWPQSNFGQFHCLHTTQQSQFFSDSS